MRTLRSRVNDLENEVALLREERQSIRNRDNMDQFYISVPMSNNEGKWIPIHLREVIDKLVKDACVEYKSGGLES